MKELLLAVILTLLWLLVKFLRKEAVFVPLPMGTVRKMLEMAKIRKSDILYDLGSGDGRTAIAAAREYGIKSVGVEKNWFLCWLSKVKIRGIQDKVKIVRGDLFDQKISGATIVTLYLSQRMNDMLEPKLKRELKKGARIVSADHTLGMKEAGWLKAGHMYLHLYRV